MTAPASRPAPSRSGFAVPAKLVVILTFLTQFMALMIGIGVYLPTLHEEGVATLWLILGAILGFAIFQVALGSLLRFVPVRCRCGDRAYFAGFGWWPFTYRFACGRCGAQWRIDVQGR